jgi:hypothetical protein
MSDPDGETSSPPASEASNIPERRIAARRVQLVRLVGGCLTMLVAVVFCQMFSSYQYDALVFGAGILPEELPGMCLLFARSSQWLLLLPVVVLWIGIRALVRDREQSTLVEVVAQTAVLVALLLVAMCILAWQAPYSPAAGVSM